LLIYNYKRYYLIKQDRKSQKSWKRRKNIFFNEQIFFLQWKYYKNKFDNFKIIKNQIY
jgi:hypothetical protein